MFELTNDYLKKCRKEKGLSQVECAKVLGITSQFISNTERYVSSLPLDKLKIYIKLIDADKNKVIDLILKDKRKELRGKL